MKRTMLIIFVDSDHGADVERLLDECAVPGYTQFATVRAKGETGRKFGSRAFPGSSTVYLVAVDEACSERLATRLNELRQAGGRAEGLKVYGLSAEEIL